MKFLKLLLFLILIVVIAGALYFATQDGSYQIEATREMNVPQEVVYDIVNEYKTWEEWGPWKKQEPTMVFNYAEKTAGEGSSYTWQGEMDGGMTTTKTIPHTRIEQIMTLDTPGGARTSQVYWDFESTDNMATKVKWGITGDHTLMDKIYYAFSGMDFNGAMKKMFEIGLNGLEKAANEEIKKYTINMDGITQFSGGFYISRTTSAKAQAVAQIMSQNYRGIQEFMKVNNITASGMPFTIYNETFENGDVIMTNAVPVREKIVVAGAANVLSGYMPTVTAIKATLKGNHVNLREARGIVMQEVANKKYALGEENPFEVYVTDPQNYPNPADWITEIYVPIKNLE